MSMSTITQSDVKNLTSDLASALYKLSDGKLNVDSAQRMAEKSIKNIDLTNSALAHKGTNWYAKEILKVIKM